MSTSFYCPQCQTPEACLSFCLFEQMQSQALKEGELNEPEGEFNGRQVAEPKISRKKLAEIADELVNF